MNGRLVLTAGVLVVSAGAFFMWPTRGVKFEPVPPSEIRPHSTVPAATSTPTVTPATLHNVPPTGTGLPIHLSIPALQVDATIEEMGLTKAGNMDVPTSIQDVGWYKLGPIPGKSGSAVIAGHLDGAHNEVGVFARLKDLKKGDSIVVEDDMGTLFTFMVKSTHLYDYTEHPSEVFTSSSGSHLNLITCAGAWDRGNKIFSKRLVVFADMLTE